MDHILTAKIYDFLQLENPTEQQIIEGATLLLKCNPNRERGIYNSAMRRPKAMLAWIRADLKKYYGIRQRGLTMPEIEKFNDETLAIVGKTLSIVPDNVPIDTPKEGSEVPLLPVMGVRGRREDHEQLPDDIKAIWDRNAERWKKMSRLHFQLAQMIEKPDYAPCDGNELCYQLRMMDTELRNDYQIYDAYEAKPATAVVDPPEGKDKVDKFAENLKIITSARTAISRGLARKTQDEASRKKIQDAVNTLFALKQVIKPVTIEKLKAIDIAIPESGDDAEG